MRCIKLAVQEGVFAHSSLLRPLSGCWSLGVKFKNILYERGVLPTIRLPVPVVSVGAITAGGSGKTPLVHLLAKTLREYGPVAILSRGYKNGDEAALLRRRLPDVPVFVGKDRILTGEAAIRRGAKVLLLDDGLQYRKLYRDFELLAIPEKNIYGFGAFLPRGLLRDSPDRLKEAAVFFVQGEPVDLPSIPSVMVTMGVSRILDLGGRTYGSLARKKVGAYCGIAHPYRFLKTLRALDADVVDVLTLADHEKPSRKELLSFYARCQEKGASLLVCTEKDSVKLEQDRTLRVSQEKENDCLVYLEMELAIRSNHSCWEDLIEKIVLKMDNCAIAK